MSLPYFQLIEGELFTSPFSRLSFTREIILNLAVCVCVRIPEAATQLGKNQLWRLPTVEFRQMTTSFQPDLYFIRRERLGKIVDEHGGQRWPQT